LQGAVLVHPLRDALRDSGQQHTPTAPNSKKSLSEAHCVAVIEGSEGQVLLEVYHDGLEDGTMVKHREHVHIPHQPPDGGEVVTVISLERIFQSCCTLTNMLEQDEAVDG
jgi:hypothetical protein